MVRTKGGNGFNIFLFLLNLGVPERKYSGREPHQPISVSGSPTHLKNRTHHDHSLSSIRDALPRGVSPQLHGPLRRAVSVAVAMLAGKDALAQGIAGDASKDVGILNVALGLEHEAINA